MRIMITGGGTGGHTSPATAILEELQKRDPRLAVQWVGRAGAIEERISAAMAIPFRSLPVEGWPRRRTPRKLWVAVKLAFSMLRAWMYLRKFNPQVVLGVGGYVSLPLVWVAQRAGVPTVLHEQNRLLGVANRMLAPRATRIFLSFPETRGAYPRERATVVGNPVRAAFTKPGDKAAARQTFELDPALPVVLVSGGSQGARSINQAMAEALAAFQAGEVQFIWMTGQQGAADARDAARTSAVPVVVLPFIEDMAAACSAADLIVSRSGASTTAEIAVMRKPSILIPYPHAADDHQAHNAAAFSEAGAAIVIADEACNGESLAGAIRALLSDPPRLGAMGTAAGTLARPAAAETIAEGILSLVFAREPDNNSP